MNPNTVVAFIILIVTILTSTGCNNQPCLFQEDLLCVINMLSDPEEEVVAFAFEEDFDPSTDWSFDIYLVYPDEPLMLSASQYDGRLCVEESVWESGAADVLGQKGGHITYEFPQAEEPELDFVCVW